MKPHWAYGLYLARHKWFVLLAGLQIGAPLWRLLIHDYTKLSRVEWGPYVRRFYGGRAGVLDKTGDPEEFHRAWAHHWQKNPHHWEHWLDHLGRPAIMPEHFAREMVADWMGAGRAITGRWEVRKWYAENDKRICLAAETRQFVESLLQ